MSHAQTACVGLCYINRLRVLVSVTSTDCTFFDEAIQEGSAEGCLTVFLSQRGRHRCMGRDDGFQIGVRKGVERVSRIRKIAERGRNMGVNSYVDTAGAVVAQTSSDYRWMRWQPPVLRCKTQRV